MASMHASQGRKSHGHGRHHGNRSDSARLMDRGRRVHSSPPHGSVSFITSTRNTQSSPTRGHSPAAGEKRVRSANDDGDQDRDGDEDDEEEEEDDSDQSQALGLSSKDLKEAQSKGRIIGRVVEAFRTSKSILEVGYVCDPELPPENYTNEENLRMGIFDNYIRYWPLLRDQIVIGGMPLLKEYARVMDKARRNVRSTDISTLKKAMKESREWDPPFKVFERHQLGFHHPQLGRLICPITLDWDAEESVRRDLLSGDVDFATGDWPYFFFTNEKPPGDDVRVVLQTFLRGELLVQGYRTIFRGPSSTIEKNARPTRPGNAQIHELTEVTVPSIAYIAVLLRHVFSSDPSFILGAGNFDHQGFYNAIIRWVDQVMPSEARKDLLKWWNEQVFGDMPKGSRKKAKRNGVLRETMEDRMTKMLAAYEKENRVRPPLEEINS